MPPAATVGTIPGASAEAGRGVGPTEAVVGPRIGGATSAVAAATAAVRGLRARLIFRVWSVPNPRRGYCKVRGMVGDTVSEVFDVVRMVTSRWWRVVLLSGTNRVKESICVWWRGDGRVGSMDDVGWLYCWRRWLCVMETNGRTCPIY